MEGWKRRWPQVAKRLREQCAEYATYAKRRRVKTKNPGKGRSLELFMQKILRAVHPADPLDFPDDDTRARLLKAKSQFPHINVVRRIFRVFTLPVHVEIVKILTASRSLSAEDSVLFEKVARSYNKCHSSPLKKQSFLVTLEQARAFRAKCLSWTVTHAAHFCLMKRSAAKLRRLVLLATGDAFAELKTEIRRLAPGAKEWKRHYWTFLAYFPRDLASYTTQAVLDVWQKVKNKPRLLPILAHELQACGKRDVVALLGGKKERIELVWQRTSSWHAKMLENLLAYEHSSRTAYRKEYMQKIAYEFCTLMSRLQTYARENWTSANCEQQILQNFFACADIQQLSEAIRFAARQTQHRPERVKNTIQEHHAAHTLERILRFVKGALAEEIGCAKDFHLLTTQRLLKGIANRRCGADPTTRRTISDEEFEAMLNVARDPAQVLMLTLFREVGLRCGAVAHLQYRTLVNEAGEPRETCIVREKGNTARCFQTSTNLQSKIRDLIFFLRAEFPDKVLDGCYVMNLADMSRPCSDLGAAFRSLAKRAGVQGAHVHPHAFRHTLVGKLMQAGNSMEIVSKFMGHRDVSTTSSFYWVPTPEELGQNLKNPFCGKSNDSQVFLELTQQKLQLCQKMLGLVWDHCDQVAVKKVLPDFETMRAAIDE